MWLVVGLGNPGDQYAGNRHNIGFMAVDEIVRRHSFGPWRTKFQGALTDGEIGGERVLALKPMTYMNNSGRSVSEAARFYKIPPEQVIVFHDEIELAPGKLRVKQGGGHAGHNGLRDIDAQFANEYLRVRLGVGRPHDKALVHNWVLSNFAKSDGEWLDSFLEAVAKNVGMLIKNDINGFMNRVSMATRPEPPKKKEKKPDSPRAHDPSTGDPSTGSPSSDGDNKDT